MAVPPAAALGGAATPARRGNICDSCGGELAQRDDDTEDSIRRRLELYEIQTAPLIEWYRTRNQLESVPGTGSPDAVTRRMVKVIEVRRQRGSGFG